MTLVVAISLKAWPSDVVAEVANEGIPKSEVNRGAVTEERQPRERKSLTGRVTKVDTEKNLLWVKPRSEDIMRFRYRPEKLKVTLQGEEASPADIEEGQRAEVTFLAGKAGDEGDKRGAARAVKLNLRSQR